MTTPILFREYIWLYNRGTLMLYEELTGENDEENAGSENGGSENQKQNGENGGGGDPDPEEPIS